ncbi:MULTISPECIES: hypothetical protein [unclassified Mesorhizobium]|uniref:hypothetical protein n=1 Tax=unclassified Mesorhizobium TaxID=325217 RepID=UPI00333A7BE3
MGEALHAILGVDLTHIHGIGPYLALKLISECGRISRLADLQALHLLGEPSAAQQDLRGEVLSSRTRRSCSRVAALMRLAATAVGRTQTALGAFYRRLASIGKAKAVTATARKIAVLIYNALRHRMDYADPGASYYEGCYRQRVLSKVRRRAKSLGYALQRMEPTPAAAVS